MKEMKEMKDIVELYKRVISTMERLEKNGTFQKFFTTITPCNDVNKILIGMPFIFKPNSYEAIKTHCYRRAALCIQDAEEHLSLAKSLLDYPKILYDSYDECRDSIKEPNLIKFMEDYRKDLDKNDNIRYNDNRITESNS